jgi:cystathionine beta-lyase family protein involved in aluminum resistance
MVTEIKKKAFLECFSNFMSDSEGLAQEDLAAELKENKIDVNQLKIDVAAVVKRGSAERRLGWRRRAKQKIEDIEKILGIAQAIPVSVMNAKDKITAFIKDTYGPGALDHAEAYFRNRDMLSESDIKNLFEDLEQLESLEKPQPKQD